MPKIIEVKQNESITAQKTNSVINTLNGLVTDNSYHDINRYKFGRNANFLDFNYSKIDDSDLTTMVPDIFIGKSEYVKYIHPSATPENTFQGTLDDNESLQAANLSGAGWWHCDKLTGNFVDVYAFKDANEESSQVSVLFTDESVDLSSYTVYTQYRLINNVPEYEIESESGGTTGTVSEKVFKMWYGPSQGEGEGLPPDAAIHGSSQKSLNYLSGDSLQVYGFETGRPYYNISDISATARFLVRVPRANETTVATMAYASLSSLMSILSGGGAGGNYWVTNAAQGAYQTTNHSYDAKLKVLYFDDLT